MKYMGSKSRIAKHIVPIIQSYIDKNNINIYIEPFCGGANVIDKVNCKIKIGTDYNKYLIALLKRVQENKPLLTEVSRELYNDVRSNQNSGKYEDWFVGNVGFLASYNGRWFDGGFAPSGYEKTKNGQRFRNYYEEAKNNLLKQSESLQDIKFKCCDYQTLTSNLLNKHNEGKCVIYCDPPYQHTKQYANATKFNYDEFWETIRQWSKNQIVLISELNAPDDFECIWEQEVSRSIKATDKSKAVEKLFIYKQTK